MIGWLVDRWWLWKNQAVLSQVDAEMDALSIQKERLEKRMEETFGPYWRAEGERRLARALNGGISLT